MMFIFYIEKYAVSKNKEDTLQVSQASEARKNSFLFSSNKQMKCIEFKNVNKNKKKI